MLTTWTVKTGSLLRSRSPDRAVATWARLPFPIVDQQRKSKIARLPVRTLKISQGGASGLNGAFENSLDIACQTPVPLGSDPVGGPVRMNSGSVQGLAGVDIANAADYPGIHQ